MDRFCFIHSLFFENFTSGTNETNRRHKIENIFAKDFLIIPVNIKRNHWVLAVVCHPKHFISGIGIVLDKCKRESIEKVKNKSATYILYFDSLIEEKSSKKLQKRLKGISRQVIYFLTREANRLKIPCINKLNSIDTKSLRETIIPILPVMSSK
jgi:Ulp1 family protease